MCKRCDWETYIDDIDKMLIDPDYEFAEETLSGIRDWIEKNEHITDKQSISIDNIKSSINN